MWLSERAALGARESEPAAEIGVVTSGGARPSVMLGGERRRMETASPGGLRWMPVEGEQVIVTRCGDELFVTGSLSGAPKRTGGLYLENGNACICLNADGKIELRGEVNVVGSLMLNGVDIRKLLSLFG